jgi:hypothetical protein
MRNRWHVERIARAGIESRTREENATFGGMSNWDDEKKAHWDEDRVVRALCHWLKTEGWTTVETEKDYIEGEEAVDGKGVPGHR